MFTNLELNHRGPSQDYTRDDAKGSASEKWLRHKFERYMLLFCARDDPLIYACVFLFILNPFPRFVPVRDSAGSNWPTTVFQRADKNRFLTIYTR